MIYASFKIECESILSFFNSIQILLAQVFFYENKLEARRKKYICVKIKAIFQDYAILFY